MSQTLNAIVPNKLQKSGSARFNNILNARVCVELGDDGEVVPLAIQSATHGVFNEKLDAIVDIYNVDASKGTVLDSAWFKEQRIAALKLEKAGELEEAEKIFGELLNKSQMTFNIINRDGMARTFQKGEFIKAKIQVVDVADRDEDGNDLGTTHKSVTIKGIPVPQEVKQLRKRAAFTSELED
jgi:hypothetical protein